MAASAGINYRETYFEFPQLTKVHGEPDSESLYKLLQRAQSQRLSGLLQSHQRWSPWPSCPCHHRCTLRPAHQLTICSPSSPWCSYDRCWHHWYYDRNPQVEGVEKALIQQIVKAIEPTYLASLPDRNSNSLRGTVNNILAHLQMT
jgi:hypothetical protein